MSRINKHIVLLVQMYEFNPNDIITITLTKEENNSNYWCCWRRTPYIQLKEFLNNEFNSSKLDFAAIIGYKDKPGYYLEWLLSDKSIYEYNYGKIYKLSCIKKNELIVKQFNIDEPRKCIFTYEEIKDYIKCYKNIYEGVFSNDYSKEYGNKNVKFIKIFEI